MYNPFDWYWRRADGALWSSARAMLVTETDAAFEAWQSAGNAPTPWPRDAEGNESAAELRAVLAAHRLPGPPGAPSQDEVQAECARRIFAAASATTQTNLTAYMNKLALKSTALTNAEKADVAAFGEAFDWITAMRTKWAELLAAGDADFRDDAKWPVLPTAAAALAARF